MLAQLDWGLKAIPLPNAAAILAVCHALLAPRKHVSLSVHGLGAGSHHRAASLLTCGTCSMQVHVAFKLLLLLLLLSLSVSLAA